MPNKTKREVKKMSDLLKLLVWLVALFLPLLFGWLRFHGTDVVRIARETQTDILLKVALSVYFLSWCAGLTWDTNDQEMLYTVAPDEGRLRFGGIVIMILLLVVFIMLCFVESFDLFAGLLGVFLVINVTGWRYIISKVTPVIVASFREYETENEFADLESLRVLNGFMTGAWQWWRFAVGFSLIAFINLIAFYPPFAQIVSQSMSGLPTEFLLAIGTFSFIVVMEGWIWYQRIRTRATFSLIQEYSDRYELISKKTIGQ